MKASRRRRKRKAGLKQADTLFAQKVKERDAWRCVMCGRSNVQCAHIVSRRYRAVRWDMDNAVTLCAQHHTFFTFRPLEWERWVVAYFGQRKYDDLKARALVVVKPDYGEVIERLSKT